MSHDVHLEIETGPEAMASVGDWNYTSNCSRMWRHALGGETRLADLDGMPASEAGPLLAAAAKRMKDDPATYKAMDPSNGWGDHVSAGDFLAEIAESCARHPKTTLSIRH